MPASRTPLKITSPLAAAATVRAIQLNLSKAAYVGILIWNHAQSPVEISTEAGDADVVRVPFPTYWKTTVSLLADRMAREAGTSVNALAEALIALDIRSGERGLNILPANGSEKPSLKTKKKGAGHDLD